MLTDKLKFSLLKSSLMTYALILHTSPVHGRRSQTAKYSIATVYAEAVSPCSLLYISGEISFPSK